MPAQPQGMQNNNPNTSQVMGYPGYNQYSPQKLETTPNMGNIHYNQQANANLPRGPPPAMPHGHAPNLPPGPPPHMQQGPPPHMQQGPPPPGYMPGPPPPGYHQGPPPPGYGPPPPAPPPRNGPQVRVHQTRARYAPDGTLIIEQDADMSHSSNNIRIVNQPPVVNIPGPDVYVFTEGQAKITCPYCRYTGYTRIEKKMDSNLWIWIILCIIFIWSIVGLIILCCICASMNNYEITHYCTNCNRELGRRIR